MSDELGLPVASLEAFQIGRLAPRVYSFPEFDASGTCVGIVRRTPGEKRAMPESVRGLSIPLLATRRAGLLLIAEGASDAISLFALGQHAVGRPSASPSERVYGWLLTYCWFPGTEGVVVVGDNDPPDRRGEGIGETAARDLARRLRADLPGSVPVGWALPAPEFKDVREMYRSNPESVISNMQIHALGGEVQR